jgi:hypothetical protein
MMHRVETARTFTIEDQRAFAALSGDRNPVHLDPVEARRLMPGKVVVHGMHLVLFALDRLLADGLRVGSLARLWVQFDRFAGIDEPIRLERSERGGRILVRIDGPEGTLARLHLTPGALGPEKWSGSTRVPRAECLERELPDLAGAAAELELALPPEWARAFPHLATGFSARQVAVLLATTRLVGMICPGRDSLYAALQLEFAPSAERAATLEFAVVRTDARTGLVEMRVRSPEVSGTVSALMRPKPFAQPPIVELQRLVPAHAFSGQRAIVIGGSRGLAAKLLAAGGADATITFLHGEADARRIGDEAAAAGRAIRSMRYDVADPPALAAPEAPYTHLYYFATPRIEKGERGQFNAARFARFVEYYVNGAARTAEWFRPRAVSASCFWYPSSVFVEERNPYFAEYAAAKRCGEALCAELGQALAPMRFVFERLPGMPSDQTQSPGGSMRADGASTLLAALQRVAIRQPP